MKRDCFGLYTGLSPAEMVLFSLYTGLSPVKMVLFSLYTALSPVKMVLFSLLTGLSSVNLLISPENLRKTGLLSRKWTPKNENVLAEIPTALSFGGALETINLKPRLIASNA
ncbi:hypothetical protein I7V34_06820 [Bacillus sp. V3]|nr:hypothetical protein I7V34_06820 [Bacillus sp. V3]